MLSLVIDFREMNWTRIRFDDSSPFSEVIQCDFSDSSILHFNDYLISSDEFGVSNSSSILVQADFTRGKKICSIAMKLLDELLQMKNFKFPRINGEIFYKKI